MLRCGKLISAGDFSFLRIWAWQFSFSKRRFQNTPWNNFECLVNVQSISSSPLFSRENFVHWIFVVTSPLRCSEVFFQVSGSLPNGIIVFLRNFVLINSTWLECIAVSALKSMAGFTVEKELLWKVVTGFIILSHTLQHQFCLTF